MHSALPGAHGWRAATGANGFSLQHDTRLHFGLGAAAPALVPIRIRWCGGATTEYRLPRDGYQRAVNTTLGRLMPPPIRKRLIYLDQMVLSNIAKALDPIARTDRERDDSYWLLLYERLDLLLKLQEAVFPSSDTQRRETSLSRYPDLLRRLISHFSQGVTFKSSLTVLRAQTLHGFEAWIRGEQPDYRTIRRNWIISGQPDTWMERLQVLGRRRDSAPENARHEQRSAEAYRTIMQIFRHWQTESNKRLEDWYLLERSATVSRMAFAAHAYLDKVSCNVVEEAVPLRDVLVTTPPRDTTLYSLLDMAVRAGLTLDRAANAIIEYIESEVPQRAPKNDINALLLAGIARKAASGQKDLPQSTINDLDVISTSFPYVDAIFVDDYFAGLIAELRNEKRKSMRGVLDYSVRVFSNKNKDDFLDYLRELEISIPAAHREMVVRTYGKDWLNPYTEILEHHRARTWRA